MSVVVKDPASITEEDAKTVLIEKGYVVRTQDEDTTFLNNAVAVEADKKAKALVGEKWRNQNEAFEKKIFEATGVVKNQGENAEAYLIRAASEVKGLDSQKVKELYEGQITTLKTNLETKEAEIKKIQTDRIKDVIVMDLKTSASLIEIAVPPHLTDPAQIEAYKTFQRENMTNTTLSKYQSEIIDGKPVYSINDATGQPVIQRDSKTGLPLTSAQIYERDYAFNIAPKPETKKGTGTNSPVGNGNQQKVVIGKDESVHEYISKNHPEVRPGSVAYGTLAEELETSRAAV